MGALITRETALEAMDAQGKNYTRLSVSPATRRAHRTDWRLFREWCEANGLQALPASVGTILRWLSDNALRYKPASLERKLASISKMHQVTDHEERPTRDPRVRAVLKGIRNVKRDNGEPVRPAQKAPVTSKDLRAMVQLLPDTVRGARDRAVLLLGYAGGFRRSELSNLTTEDIEFRPEGVLVTLRYSKTNQDGAELEQKDIGMGATASTCPVRALERWLRLSGITEGPVFRSMHRSDVALEGRLSGDAIALIVKRTAAAIGKNPKEVAAHSLRSGFITDAFDAGLPTPVIMGMTGHRTERILNQYYRKAKLFDKNLSATVGL